MSVLNLGKMTRQRLIPPETNASHHAAICSWKPLIFSSTLSYRVRTQNISRVRKFKIKAPACLVLCKRNVIKDVFPEFLNGRGGQMHRHTHTERERNLCLFSARRQRSALWCVWTMAAFDEDFYGCRVAVAPNWAGWASPAEEHTGGRKTANTRIFKADSLCSRRQS